MEAFRTLTSPRARFTRLIRVCAAAFVLTSPAGWHKVARAADVTAPPVPDTLRVPVGNKAFRVGHAVGIQSYICQPSGAAFAWTFVKPQATLSDDHHEPIVTHYLSTNQFETPPAARPTWQDSVDMSRVWGTAIASSSDPNFVAKGAIPWLLLRAVGSQPGPTGGTALTATTFLQRLTTSGGVAPTTGCAQSADAGKMVSVPYTADYFFYKAE